ncbi:MAG: ABC transporter ATP-binding protein [Acidimicrobiia bacterium]|nr:ABC transporter ATP-binding protein [Acidimicrobiia bacterium]
MSYLQAIDISKRFNGVSALAGVDIAVERGESLALLGPSGCGKTTLLRILAGLEVPDRGDITLEGRTLTGPARFVPPEQRRIGMVFQDWALFPHMTVARNVAFGLGKAGINRSRVSETLDLVGLSHLADRYPDELSGGQAQRVAVARALAPRPRVLLFDEPFSNLDTGLRTRIRADVAALMRDVRMTSIFVTHDQEESFVVGDRVAVMREGQIEQVGRPADVYQHPASAWVATFVGEANVLGGVATNGHVSTAVGDVPLADPVKGPCRVVVRPEYLAVGRGDQGVVSSVEFYGHDTTYELALNGTKLVARVIAAPDFVPGDRVSVSYAGPGAAAFTAGTRT